MKGAAKKIIKRWRNRRNNHNNRNKQGPVGTEAKAIANLEKNGKAFDYPSEGFVNKVEYSLLYNMIGEPTIYPEETVLTQISEEDFTEYMVINSRKNEEGERISYGQLSAILALASEKYPSRKTNNGITTTKSTTNLSVAETLCKAVLKTVLEYVETQELDRELECKELMDPVERHFINRDNKHQLRMNLPFYIGYTATILTLNPLPMLVGATMMCGAADQMSTERRNIESISSDTHRRADTEKTGLLDETF